MSLDAAVMRSRELVARWWHVVANRCTDPRLAQSILQPVEGLNGHRALDLDRRSHIDSIAVVGGRWTPLSTRFQRPEFADHHTATFRRTEVEHLRKAFADRRVLAADLHVQFYGEESVASYVIVAALHPVARYFAETPLDAHWWLTAYDGTPFVALGRGRNGSPGHGTLRALEAFVWDCCPTATEQMELFR